MTRRPASAKALPPRDCPVLSPKDGLRQRKMLSGQWRVWWEPTARQRKAGAEAIELSHLRPGEAQRRATAENTRWNDGRAIAPRGYSVSALIADYKVSRYFTERAATTQDGYRVNMRAIENKWGPHAVAVITPPIMVQWYETLLTEKGQTRSRALLIMMSILMVHAERRGWIPKGANPCRDIGMAKPPPRNRVASTLELAALLSTADQKNPAIALALRLAMHTGQRATDIRLASAQDFQAALLPVPWAAEPVPGYIWRLVRSKRGNAGIIPIVDHSIVAALRAGIDRTSADPGATDKIILNGHGKPYTRDRFQKSFAAIRESAAKDLPSLATLEWRDLRRTVGVQLRMAGVTRDDAGDLLGNTLATNATLAATYTPVTNTSTTLRAVTAINLPERKKA